MIEEKSFSNILDELVGDVPVSEQLSSALTCTAAKDHEHAEYATRAEYQELKSKIDLLIELVGDVPVAEQISAAIQ